MLHAAFEAGKGEQQLGWLIFRVKSVLTAGFFIPPLLLAWSEGMIASSMRRT